MKQKSISLALPERSDKETPCQEPLINFLFWRKKEKPKSVRILQWIYIATFFCIVSLVTLIHSTERPFLDILRLPTFFRGVEGDIGISYIASMTVYHFTFAYFLLIIAIDALSLTFFENRLLKYLSLASSIFGFFLLGFMIFYFIFSTLIIGITNPFAQTSLIFLCLSVIFFVLDIFIFIIDEHEIYPGFFKLLHKKLI